MRPSASRQPTVPDTRQRVGFHGGWPPDRVPASGIIRPTSVTFFTRLALQSGIDGVNISQITGSNKISEKFEIVTI
jgi:hypothetical protein